MSGRNVVVVKFGSSVLAGAAGFGRAVEQVAALRDRGKTVCAVVSATPGTTDRLWAEAHALAVAPDPQTLGELLATGEHASVALLAIALRSRGVDAARFSAERLDLRTEGDPLDATPCGFDQSALVAALETRGVVVAPGFVGRDREGRFNLLGRGGSDLTALFLSHSLGAGCRLVKDVDGLFDSDPNAPTGLPARRYTHASWEELARVGDVVVQPKAVAFARTRAQRFTIAAPGGRGTEVGPGPNVLERVAS